MNNKTNLPAIITEVILPDSAMGQQLPIINTNQEVIITHIMDPEQNAEFLRNGLRAIMQEIAETPPEELAKVKTVRTTQKVYITFAPAQIEVDLK